MARKKRPARPSANRSPPPRRSADAITTGRPAPVAAPGADETAAAPPWRWLLAIAGLGFALRAAVAVELSDVVLYRYPQLDSLEFLLWAQSIARGEAHWPAVPTHGPGYPYLLATLLALFDGSLLAARLVQAALGGLLCGLVGVLAARIFDRRAAIAASLLLAVYGPLVYVETALLAEGSFLLLLCAALAALLWPARTPRGELVAVATAGLLLGMAAAVRATALPLLVAAIVLVALERRRSRRLAGAAVLAAAALVVVLPVLAQVRQASGSWLPIQAYGGLNLWMGNRPGAPGVPTARVGGDWDRLSGEPAREGIAGAAAQERYFTRRALAAIAAEPGAWLAVLGRKALWLVQDEEIRESHSYYFFRAQSVLLRLLPGFALLFPLAMVGLLRGVRERRLPAAIAVYLLVMTASCVGIVVSSRYRLPLVPVLAVLAGGGAGWLLATARQRRWRALLVPGAVAAGALLLTLIRDHAPSRNPAEEWALTAASLETRNDLAAAREAVARALDADRDSALAWSLAGRLAVRAEDWPAAESAFATAVRLSPDYHLARLNLGSVRRKHGDLASALPELRHARELLPAHPATLRELGEALVAAGEVEEARRVYGELVEIAPDAGTHLALARLEGAARNPARGAEHAAAAARLRPGEPEPWLTLAMLSLDAGDAPQAREALTRASGLLGPESPPIALGWALLDRLEGRPAAAADRLRRVLARHPDYQPAAQLLRSLGGS
jgi:tetratricopeptide (TPR) repeat protein